MSRPERVLAAIDRTLACVRRHPRVVVQFFAPDWPGVDLARERALAAGLADRVRVHHRGALALLGRPAA